MPSEPASVSPCSTALSVCEEETLNAGKAKPFALAVSSISAYCSGVAMGMVLLRGDVRFATESSEVARSAHGSPDAVPHVGHGRMDACPDSPSPNSASHAMLLDATRVAALAASERVGGGDRDAVDGAAVAAMRAALAVVPVDGRVVVGEGEKDAAPMLHLGERFGTGAGPAIDIAVDPVDGTSLAAAGLPGAMAVMAVAPRGAFLDIGPAHYMEKLVGRVPGLRLDAPLGEAIRSVAEARGVAAARRAGRGAGAAAERRPRPRGACGGGIRRALRARRRGALPAGGPSRW